MFNYGLLSLRLITCYFLYVIKRKITQQDRRLGKHIQRIRKANNLTQEQLAEKIGKSRQMITFIETSRVLPNLKMLQKIARALGVKVKDLLPY